MIIDKILNLELKMLRKTFIYYSKKILAKKRRILFLNLFNFLS
jgi:hypothetical protein